MTEELNLSEPLVGKDKKGRFAMGGRMFCWDEADVIAQSHRSHVYEFTFDFMVPFISEPAVVTSVRLNGIYNQMMSIDKNEVTISGLFVRVQNSYPERNNGIVEGTKITVSYIAIGNTDQ